MIGLNLYCHFYKLMMVCVYHTYLPQHTYGVFTTNYSSIFYKQ
jgi:hypothetical protein